MTRLARTLLVLVLLAATAAAIAKTEGLKLQSAWVQAIPSTRIFSPVCHCRYTGTASIKFKLVQSGRLTVSVINGSGKTVRVLVNHRKFRHNKLHFPWNGGKDNGQLAPDGSYRVRVALGGGLRPIVFPTPITIDTRPPVARITHVDRRVIKLSGPRSAQHVDLTYRVNERAHVSLLVNGNLRGKKRGTPLTGKLAWSATVDGRPVHPGKYHLSLVVRDLAGNVEKVRPTIVITVEKNKSVKKKTKRK